ncbi:MAG: hypothetical protein K2L12_05015 [Clostridia bacterium]|nr:hypothetical protein [Clostridia bacterium]
MRKFLVALLAVLCITLTGFAFACNQEPTYYILTYNEQPGVTFDFGEIQSGAEVKEGYTVQFKVTFDDATEGSKEVSANNEVIKPDENGVYSFVMSGDITVTANAWLVSDYKVNFDMGTGNSSDDDGPVTNENMMWYLDADGKPMGQLEQSHRGGDLVKFKLKTSVYCSDSAKNFRVTANTTVLTPDEGGVYSFIVSDNTNINVVGLHTDEDMIYRKDGSGTEEDPYILRKPIDLFAMAVYIENSFYDGYYATLHYKMDADIDLAGEKLYIIGDYPDEDSKAMFCGTFDGDGHTISNYYIEDYIIDQSNGQKVPLANIGMFGVCSATIGAPVTIKNLNLKDFTIITDGSLHNAGGFYVGGLVGYGVGVNVVNCSVSGRIEANGNSDYFGNAGGIMGYQQSVYQSDTVKHNSVVCSCASNVEIESNIGNIYAAGGISAIAASAENVSNACIIDCYSTGNIIGAIYTGGIVGSLSSYSSVANCYATGEVVAQSRAGLISGSDMYSTAYGGGIVGYASSDSIVSNSAFFGEVVASSTTAGSQYAVTGHIIGGKDFGGNLLHINSHEAVDNHNAQTATGVDFKDLGWSSRIWDLSETLPTLKQVPDYDYIAVTVVFGDSNKVEGSGAKLYELDGYNSMAASEVIPRYLTADNGNRSYGYFFDSALTIPVPTGYVPTGVVTLYVGFADYSKVAGTYYFRTQSGSSSVRVILTADGEMNFSSGALTYTTQYMFDGTNIILNASPATVIDVPNSNNGNNNTPTTYTSYTVPAMAVYSDGGELEFVYSLYISNALYRYTVAAVEESHSVSGVYYSSVSGAPEYTFYKDGSGIKGTLDRFTYTKNGNDIEITYSATQTESATLSGSTITINNVAHTAYDKLTGKWVTSAHTHESFEFDGKGGWKYKYALYNDAGVELNPKATAQGTYTFAEGVATLQTDGGVYATVTVTEEGFLKLNGGKTYYRENSFVGTWTYTSLHNPTTVTFYGIGLDGYGKVHVSHLTDMAYGDDGESSYNGLDMLYEVEGGIAYIYYGDILYGQLSYSYARGTLDGVMYLSENAAEASTVMFCLYDVYYGNWVESTEEVTPFESVKFNGLGSYDIPGVVDAYSRVRGTISIGGSTVSVTYKLTHSLTEGKFTYNGTEYTLSYNETDGTVTVSDGTNTYTLEKAQA